MCAGAAELTKEILPQESISTEKGEGQEDEAPRRRSSSRIQGKLENKYCKDDCKENKKVESSSDLRYTLKTRNKSGSGKKVSRLDQIVDKVDANRYINDKSKAKYKSKPLIMNANQQIETPAKSKSDEMEQQLNTKQINGLELNQVHLRPDLQKEFKNPEKDDLKSNESNPVIVVKETDENLDLKIYRSIEMRRSSPRKSVKDRLGIKVQSNHDFKTTSDSKDAGLESSYITSPLRILDHLRVKQSIKVAVNVVGSLDEDKEEGEVDDSDEEEISSTSTTTPVDLPQQELVDIDNINNAKPEGRKPTNPKLSPTREIQKLGPESNKNQPTSLQNDSTFERRRHLTAPQTRPCKSKPILETSGYKESVAIEKQRHKSAPAIITKKSLSTKLIIDAAIDKSRVEANTHESKKTVDSVKKEVETKIEERVNPLDFVKAIYEPNADKGCPIPGQHKKSKKECEQKKESKVDLAESELEDCSKDDGSEYDPDVESDYDPGVDGQEEGEDSKDSNYYPSEAAKKRETRSTRFKGY